MSNLSEQEDLVTRSPMRNIACRTCACSLGKEYKQYSKGTCEKYPVMKPTGVLFERELCNRYESRSE